MTHLLGEQQTCQDKMSLRRENECITSQFHALKLQHSRCNLKAEIFYQTNTKQVPDVQTVRVHKDSGHGRNVIKSH